MLERSLQRRRKSRRLSRMFDVYVAGELTRSANPDEQKKFYEDIAQICREAGLSVYLPHQHTDPISHPHLSPEEVYRKDYDIVANAKIIIAYVGQPSLGVGIELEIAKNNNIDIILIFRKDEKVSRMARGIPGVKAIQYESQKDALNQLKKALKK
jgi:hypothetical protein